MRLKFTPSAQSTGQLLQGIDIKLPERLKENLLRVMK
jgi:hypothetical protein